MALWFGVSAVSPQVASALHLSAAESSWLTLAVQLGFVAGTLFSATLNLPDIMKPRHLMAVCCVAGAAVNVAFAFAAHSFMPAVVLRFATGVLLAGVYPPGMKVIATWFRTGRGLALGVLVGALTLGKASPYLINVLDAENWRVTVLAASLSALLGGALVAIAVHDGPYALPNQPFDITQVAKVFSNRGVRLANFGYFGHMWELYAMWAWIPAMMRASVAISGDARWIAEAGSFAIIGAGAVGCVAAGLLADRLGRTLVASAAMLVSGLCCLVVGFAFGGPSAILLVIAAVWGATVVADSAQFSACVTELGDPRYLGTALTIQTSIGFLITVASIALIPKLVDAAGWQWAFAALAPGPFLGILAMMRLRSLPEAQAIASGRR